MFRNDKLPSLRHSYNVFEYFLNKDSGSKKTLLKRQYTNGSSKEQPFLKKWGNNLYSSHQVKKGDTSMYNASVLLILCFPPCFQFYYETEDNSIQTQVYDSYIIKVAAVLSIHNDFLTLYCQ